jgi:hypothetical protein
MIAVIYRSSYSHANFPIYFPRIRVLHAYIKVTEERTESAQTLAVRLLGTVHIQLCLGYKSFCEKLLNPANTGYSFYIVNLFLGAI